MLEVAQVELDRIAGAGLAQPAVHAEHLDRGEDRVCPTFPREDRNPAHPVRPKRGEVAVLVEGRAIVRERALGLRDDRVAGLVIGLARVDARQPPERLLGKSLASRRQEAVDEGLLGDPRRVAGGLRVDAARELPAVRNLRVKEVRPRVGRHQGRECQEPAPGASPGPVAKRGVRPGGQEQPRLAAAVRAADDADPARRDPGQGGTRVGQQPGQVLRVADLELLAGKLDLPARVAVPAGAVVEDRVAARCKPDVVPADRLVRVCSAIGAGAGLGRAEVLRLVGQEAVQEDQER